MSASFYDLLKFAKTGIASPSMTYYDKLKALELLGKYLGLFEARGNLTEDRQTNLLQAILEATAKEVDVRDLPELQQAAAAGHDLVEQTEAEEF